MTVRIPPFVVAVVDDDQSILQSLEYSPGIGGLRRAPVHLCHGIAGERLPCGDRLPDLGHRHAGHGRIRVAAPGSRGASGLPIILITGYPDRLKRLPPLGRKQASPVHEAIPGARSCSQPSVTSFANCVSETGPLGLAVRRPTLAVCDASVRSHHVLPSAAAGTTVANGARGFARADWHHGLDHRASDAQHAGDASVSEQRLPRRRARDQIPRRSGGQHFVLSSLSPGAAQKRLALASCSALLVALYLDHCGPLSGIQLGPDQRLRRGLRDRDVRHRFDHRDPAVRAVLRSCARAPFS